MSLLLLKEETRAASTEVAATDGSAGSDRFGGVVDGAGAAGEEAVVVQTVIDRRGNAGPGERLQRGRQTDEAATGATAFLRCRGTGGIRFAAVMRVVSAAVSRLGRNRGLQEKARHARKVAGRTDQYQYGNNPEQQRLHFFILREKDEQGQGPDYGGGTTRIKSKYTRIF